MKILPLRIENGRLILDGVRLAGVKGYTIKISSELPKGNAELNLKIIVSFPENTQEHQSIKEEPESKETRRFIGEDCNESSKKNVADDLKISTAQFGKKSLKWYIRMLCANVKTDPSKMLKSWGD